ncbi:MAG TPA: hypothetical protein VIM24_10335 [Candidatus Limnocylindrales bacterium]
MTIEHRATRLIEQRPEVVHARLLELAERLRHELPPIEPGTQAASVLGVSGPLDVQVSDQGPNRIELRTTQGRIRGEAAADLVATPDGKTALTLEMVVNPLGFAANMMLGVALKTMPGIEQRIVDGLEAALTDLATELAKPDGVWDAAAWTPPGLTR